jgi:hypothetical protein
MKHLNIGIISNVPLSVLSHPFVNKNDECVLGASKFV